MVLPWPYRPYQYNIHEARRWRCKHQPFALEVHSLEVEPFALGVQAVQFVEVEVEVEVDLQEPLPPLEVEAVQVDLEMQAEVQAIESLPLEDEEQSVDVELQVQLVARALEPETLPV